MCLFLHVLKVQFSTGEVKGRAPLAVNLCEGLYYGLGCEWGDESPKYSSVSICEKTDQYS